MNSYHDFAFKALKNSQFSYNSHSAVIEEKDDDGNPKISKKLRAIIKDDTTD